MIAETDPSNVEVSLDDLMKPLPSQQEFLTAMYTIEYLLFGGSAGPGKSHVLRWAQVELLMFWYKTLGLKYVKTGLFCETYPALKDRHISKISETFPRWMGEVKDTKTDGLGFYLNEKYGGGIILLRNLDDPAKYQSVEFAAIGVDELTKNSKRDFDDLRARKRWPGINHSPFMAATNPGSIGHVWVKKIWIDKDFSGDDSELDPSRTPHTFKFIPARGRENPYLPQSYWDTLHSLPLALRKAMEEGNWDVFVGQYFEEWNSQVHVCSPFKIPYGWRRVIGIDYGFEKPSSVGWYAIDPEGFWYRYRELYKTRMTYPVLSKEILEMTPLDEPIYCAIADPAIWGDRARDAEEPGESGGEIMEAEFDSRDIPLLRGNHDRIQGWQRIRSLIAPFKLPNGNLQSRFKVFSTNTNFIRTFPALVHDEVRTEDLNTHGEDHCADEFRYVVNNELKAGRDRDQLSDYDAAVSQIPRNAGIGFRR